MVNYVLVVDFAKLGGIVEYLANFTSFHSLNVVTTGLMVDGANINVWFRSHIDQDIQELCQEAGCRCVLSSN